MSEELKRNDFIVRDFRNEDFDAVNELWSKTGMGGAHRGDNPEIISETISKGGYFLILEYLPEKKVVGTAWITNDFRRLYLHHFGITPEFQGKGLSNLLAKECMVIGKKTGLQMKLEVHHENIIAKSLYLKYGFKELGDYEVLIIRKY